MTAPSIDNAPIGAAGDARASDAAPAHESSGYDRAARAVLNRIADVAERHGWNPLACRLSDFIEAQLTELDRYRVAVVDRTAAERENAVTAKHNAANEG